MFKSINPLKGMNSSSSKYIYIATFTNNDEPKKLLTDCANARTVIEYQSQPDNEIKEQTLYWRSASVKRDME
jgi:hypothetical protein